jgi:hypothetical protein
VTDNEYIPLERFRYGRGEHPATRKLSPAKIAAVRELAFKNYPKVLAYLAAREAPPEDCA